MLGRLLVIAYLILLPYANGSKRLMDLRGSQHKLWNVSKKKAKPLKKEKGKELVCGLIMDEMSIREHVQWTGEKNVGYVNYGFDMEVDNLLPAKDALVFMIVGINCGWKVPVAYFLINGLCADERANLVRECIKMLHQHNVEIVALTFDGTNVNLTTASVLGADVSGTSKDTFFEHPVTKEPIFIMLDAAHMIKLIRNSLSDWEVFLDDQSYEFRWEFFVHLVNIQNKNGLHLATKIRSRHINYQNEKMKVKLAVQTFSSSVADTLNYCKDDLILLTYRQSSATSNFCRIFDSLFDILNSRNTLSSSPYKKRL